MDEALRRTPTIDPRPLEDLVRRIDGVRFSVERQAEQRPDAAKLEAVCSTSVRSSTARWPPAPIRSSDVHAAGTDGSPGGGVHGARLRRRTSIPGRSRIWPGVSRPYERQWSGREISDRTPRSWKRPERHQFEARSPNGRRRHSKALTSTLQELTARLEDAFLRPAPSTKFRPRPLEDLARRIESVRTTAGTAGGLPPARRKAGGGAHRHQFEAGPPARRRRRRFESPGRPRCRN